MAFLFSIRMLTNSAFRNNYLRLVSFSKPQIIGSALAILWKMFFTFFIIVTLSFLINTLKNLLFWRTVAAGLFSFTYCFLRYP